MKNKRTLPFEQRDTPSPNFLAFVVEVEPPHDVSPVAEGWFNGGWFVSKPHRL